MKKLIAVMMLLLIAGCQPARQAILDISLEDAENVKMMREVSKRFKEGHLVKAGFWDVLLRGRKEELPKEVFDAIEELNLLAEKEELTDWEVGQFLGLKLFVSGSIWQAILEKHAPNVIEFLPLLF